MKVLRRWKCIDLLFPDIDNSGLYANGNRNHRYGISSILRDQSVIMINDAAGMGYYLGEVKI